MRGGWAPQQKANTRTAPPSIYLCVRPVCVRLTFSYNWYYCRPTYPFDTVRDESEDTARRQRLAEQRSQQQRPRQRRGGPRLLDGTNRQTNASRCSCFSGSPHEMTFHCCTSDGSCLGEMYHHPLFHIRGQHADNSAADGLLVQLSAGSAVAVSEPDPPPTSWDKPMTVTLAAGRLQFCVLQWMGGQRQQGEHLLGRCNEETMACVADINRAGTARERERAGGGTP